MSSPNTRRLAENDILIRLTIANRGPEKATLHLLPTLWFRNTWSWGPIPEESHKQTFNRRWSAMAWYARNTTCWGIINSRFEGDATPLFTENETNSARILRLRRMVSSS